jgi:hypothetical protein
MVPRPSATAPALIADVSRLAHVASFHALDAESILPGDGAMALHGLLSGKLEIGE